MNELSQLKKHLIYSYVPRFLNLLIVPFQTSILVKNLSIQDYGVWTTLQNSAIMLTFIFSLGIQKFLPIKIPGKRKSIQYTYFKSILFAESFSYIFLSCILFLMLDNILSIIHLSKYKQSVQVLLAIYLFNLIYSELGRFLTYRKKIGTRVVLSSIEKIVEFIFLLFAFYAFGVHSVFGLTIVYALLYIIMLFFYSKISLEFISFLKTKTKILFIKKALFFSFPLIVSDISWRLIQNSDYYFLSAFDMKKELSVYAFITKIINYIYLAGSPIIWTIYPYLAEAYNKKKCFSRDVNFLIEKQFRFTFLFLCLAIGIILVNLDIFVLILAKKEYLSYRNAYFLYALYPILLTIMYINQQQILLNGNSKLIGISYFAGFLVNIILNYIFIERIGVYGAILATIISILLIVLLQKFKGNIKAKVNNILYIYPFIILLMVILINKFVSIHPVLANIVFFTIFFLLSFLFKIIDFNLIKGIKVWLRF